MRDLEDQITILILRSRSDLEDQDRAHLWRRLHPNGRLGANTGESYPHQTAKLFRLKSQQEV